MKESEKYYSKPMNDDQMKAAKVLRDSFAHLAGEIALQTYAGRCQSIGLTKLEEAAMFITKSISHEWKP